MEKPSLKIFDVAIATIPIVLVYFAGIVYISTYLSIFGISVFEVDLEIPLVLSFSYNVFSSKEFLIVSSFAVIISIFIFSIRESFELQVIEYFRYSIVHVISLLLFMLVTTLFIGHCANIAARREAEALWKGSGALVSFRGPLSEDQFNISIRTKLIFRRCHNLDQMRHVLTSKTHIYAFCPGTSKTGILFAQALSDNSVMALREVAR